MTDKHHFLVEKKTPFSCGNANLPNRTCFTRLRGGLGERNFMERTILWTSGRFWEVKFQKAAEVWKKDVWDLQTRLFEVRFSLENDGKDGKSLKLPDSAWKSFRDHPKILVSFRVWSLDMYAPLLPTCCPPTIWAISLEFCEKPSAKQKRDRGRDSQPRPRLRLNSQTEGTTKLRARSVDFC